MSAHAILATVTDRPGILYGMTKVLAEHEANISYIDIHNGDPYSTTYFELTLEDSTLHEVLEDLREVPACRRSKRRRPSRRFMENGSS
jgi:predicted amino acid-binding ACT domain protein